MNNKQINKYNLVKVSFLFIFSTATTMIIIIIIIIFVVVGKPSSTPNVKQSEAAGHWGNHDLLWHVLFLHLMDANLQRPRSGKFTLPSDGSLPPFWRASRARRPGVPPRWRILRTPTARNSWCERRRSELTSDWLGLLETNPTVRHAAVGFDLIDGC